MNAMLQEWLGKLEGKHGKCMNIYTHTIKQQKMKSSYFFRGTEEYLGIDNRVALINSTLGKALGGAAGIHFIALSMSQNISPVLYRWIYNWSKKDYRHAKKPLTSLFVL